MKRLFALLFVFGLLLSGCEFEPPHYVNLDYRVEGTVTRANIDYFSEHTGYHEKVSAAVPWVHVETGYLPGDAFSLTAQSLEAAGTLTVTAIVNGAPIATETTSASFGFVAIQGVLP